MSGPNPHPARDLVAMAALTFMALCFGGTYVAARVALEELAPFTVAAVRFTLASVLLFAWTRLTARRLSPLTRTNLPFAIGLGLTAVAGYNIWFLWGLTLAPATDGAIIVPGMAPIFTSLLAVVFLRERLGLAAAVGIGVACAGLILVFTPAVDAGPERVLGDVLFLLAALFWALYGVISKLAQGSLDSISATLYSVCIGALVLLPLAAWEGGLEQIQSASQLPWLGVTYLAVFGSVLAYAFLQFGIRRIGAARASLFSFLVPIFGVASSALLLNESVTVVTLAGGLLVLAGLWIANRPRGREPRHRMPSPPR